MFGSRSSRTFYVTVGRGFLFLKDLQLIAMLIVTLFIALSQASLV